MVMIASDELVQEFYERTIKNLDYICKASETGKDVYEATQLINSLLGLIVLPKERAFDKIPETPLDDLDGWPSIEMGKGCNNIKQFCRLMRHAVAHYNLVLLGDKVIEGVRFQNKNNNDEVTWERDFRLRDVKVIAEKLHLLLLSEEQPA